MTTPSLSLSPVSISLITALADVGDLSDAEYRAIYNRCAGEHVSFRKIRDALDPLRKGVSHAWWRNYANGFVALSREQREALRRWAGLPELPPTVAEAVAAHAHPDAAVYQVGAAVASRVILVGADVPAVDLRLNGAVSVSALPAPVSDDHVTDVTATPGVLSEAAGHLARRQRPKYLRPCLSPDPRRRLAQLATLTAQTQHEIEIARPASDNRGAA